MPAASLGGEWVCDNEPTNGPDCSANGNSAGSSTALTIKVGPEKEKVEEGRRSL
ncbi:MAG TPA: hypothetical protein VFN26_11750 [Candidatus Acidoferrum sp.]|nr:hypothetical protein [Candidatus Acidoferrum sp.]